MGEGHRALPTEPSFAALPFRRPCSGCPSVGERAEKRSTGELERPLAPMLSADEQHVAPTRGSSRTNLGFTGCEALTGACWRGLILE